MIRSFSSYGPIDVEENYYAPRKELINKTYNNLIGKNPKKGGNYITVWAPRQTGKTWALHKAYKHIREDDVFDVNIISMGFLKSAKTEESVITGFIDLVNRFLNLNWPIVNNWGELKSLFSCEHLKKPIILILDEFDALEEEFINEFANLFREIYISRRNEENKFTHEKEYLLFSTKAICYFNFLR